MEMNDLSGTQIRGYELQKLLGAGGFGVVYEAYQTAVKRAVAVKIVLPEYANHPEFIRRFEVEAQLIARLEHLHIIPLYDYWREPNCAYLVMRMMRGGSLRELLNKGPLPLVDTAKMLNQICAALAVAHRNGVIHRDIKPDNVLLDEEQNAYLADFGVAKDLEHASLAEEDADEGVTGSPHYLSPEQITSSVPSPRTDVYSMGVVLFEMLTGQAPFQGTSISQLIFKHLQEPLPGLSSLRSDLPLAINEVIQRATHKDPDKRFASALELAAAFQQALPRDELLADAEAFVGMSKPLGLEQFGITEELLAVDLAGLAVANPYKGLRAFQEADADDFFGREALVETLLERMRETEADSRFLAVVGPSGSGKSSVVKAGLLPQLRRNALEGSSKWFLVEMVPGSNPFEEVENALLRVAVGTSDRAWSQLRESEEGLSRVIEEILSAHDDVELVLVVDQFEEIFARVEDEAIRSRFLMSLLTAVQNGGHRLRVIATLRADFYDRPLLYPGLGKLFRERTEVVLPMTKEELQRAITEPAENAGLALEAGLVTAIVTDVGEQPGTLPLLQYALTELYERRDGHWLTHGAYRQIGGVLGALARRADELYESLDTDGKRLARQLFLRLITPGEGAEDTRRRVLQTEVLSLHDEPAAMQAVIDLFGKYRILTFDRDPATRSPTVEIAHEALIRRWGALREWIDNSREDLRLHRRLRAATDEWVNAGKDRSFLASGTRLDQFERWQIDSELALAHAEREYLQASIAERERQRAEEEARLAHEAALERRSRNRLRALAVVLFVAAIVASILSIFAVNRSKVANNNAATATVAQGMAEEAAEVAIANETEARSLALAASARLALNDHDTDLAIALALAANDMENPPRSAQRALIDAAYAPGTRRVFSGHEGWVRSVAFSPDGTMVLSGATDHTLILWDVATGEIIRQFGAEGEGHTDWVWSVAFLPSGQQAISASSDRTLILWNVATGEIIRRFGAQGEGHADVISSLSVSDDGTKVLSGSWDQTLILWDIATGEIIQKLSGGHAGKITGVALGPGGFTALSGGEDRRVILWNMVSGQPLLRFEGHQDEVTSVAFTTDGVGALSAAADQDVILWSFETAEPIRHYRGHSARVLSVAVSSDGRMIASAAQDRSVILWDFETGARLQTFKGHSDHVNGVTFSPDGQALLSGSADSDMRLWDIRNGAELRHMEGHEYPIRAIAVNPEATMLVSGGLEGELILWDISQAGRGQIIDRLEGHTEELNDVAFNPVGRTVASASKDRQLLLWDASTGSVIKSLEGHTDQVLCVDFSPDGRYLASGSADNTVILWDIETGELVWRAIKHTYWVLDVTFSPDGQSIMSASADHTMILWDVETGLELHTYNGHTNWVREVSFSPDGRRAISASADNSLILWNVAAASVIKRLEGHSAQVLSVAFGPDGLTAISGSRDATIILWDLDNGEELLRFAEHETGVWGLVFSPGGQTVFSGSDDKTIREWRLDYELNEIREWIQSNRHVRELTCAEREQYRVEPYCILPTPTPDPNAINL